TVVSASGDSMILLWDTATGVILQTLKGHKNYIGTVVFSPDSKTIASGSGDYTVRLWDVATGAALQTFKDHWTSVRAVYSFVTGQRNGGVSIRRWHSTALGCGDGCRSADA